MTAGLTKKASALFPSTFYLLEGDCFKEGQLFIHVRRHHRHMTGAHQFVAISDTCMDCIPTVGWGEPSVSVPITCSSYFGFPRFLPNNEWGHALRQSSF